MAIIDKNLLCWDDNATWTAGVSASIALSEVGKVRDGGQPMEFVFQVTTAFTGTFNIDINVVTASNANLTTNQVVQQIVVDGVTALAEGALYKGTFFLNVADADATHIGFEVVVNSGTVTGGVASAWLGGAGEYQSTIND